MDIAAYCRVSTDKNDQLNSLEAQKNFFTAYAAANHHNLVTIYADEGISGTKIKHRTQFQRLMRDAERRLFDLVVVKDISRFARNTVDFLQSIRTLKALGIETQFLTANQTVLGNSEFILTIFGALAQEESANTSKRVKFGKKINAQRGRVPNFVYGYDKTKGDYFDLVINEAEAKIVRRIYNLYIDDGYGSNKIAQLLNGEGIKTKRDCTWSQNAISRILSNELYCGRVINGKEEIEDFLTSKRTKKEPCDWCVVDKPELRIIEDERFQRAAEIAQSRRVSFSAPHQRQSNQHLFSTLIQCPCCGYSFRRMERVYKNTYVKWVCSGRNVHGKDSCQNKSKIDEQELKDALQAYFIRILQSKEEVIKQIIAEFRRIYHSKEENTEYEQELMTQLLRAKKRRKKCMDMYEDELISRAELQEKVSVLNAEIEACEKKQMRIKYQLEQGDQLEKILANTFQNLESILSMDDMSNAQLKRILHKIVVDGNGNIEVYLKQLSDIGLEQSVLLSDART